MTAFNPFKKSISEYNELAPEKGRALLSEPFMEDPYFKRSVILLVENNEDGTVGFLLNHPLNIELNSIINDFEEAQSKVFLGGPVDPQSLFYIHSRPDLIQDSLAINSTLYWNGSFEDVFSAIKNGQISEKEIRFFLGYSGWEKGQLAEELKLNSWLISAINDEDILNINTDNLWRDILIREGGQKAIMANFPADPTLN